jgi:predicted Zn-dependent peptidase
MGLLGGESLGSPVFNPWNPEMGIQPSIRPSGTACVLERVSYSYSVTIGFWFPIGSGTEKESERGFTHFVEHMMFKGTETRSACLLAQEAERAGGYLNAFTERNCLGIHCTLPKDSWTIALDLLADMAFHSVFSSEEFEHEKAVVYSEVLSVKDDPDEDSSDEYHRRIWEGHPLSRRIAGEPEEVEKIQRDDLYRYYQANFSPASLTVTAAGDFDPCEFEKRLDGLLGGIPRGNPIAQILPPKYKPGKWTHPAATGQIYLVAGTVFSDSLSRDDLCAMDALNCAFGESSSSRLFQNIREKEGICYSIGSSFASTESLGAFYISAVSSASAFPRLWSMIQKELDALRKEGLSKVEMDDAVAHIYGQDIVAADDTDTRMRALARQWLRYAQAEPYIEMAGRIHSVNMERVQHVCDLVFSSPLSVLAYGRITQGVRKALGDAG